MKWKDILGNDWSFTEQGEAASPAADTTAENLAIPLSHLHQIEVSGDDAGDFLQGQFSSDIKQLDEASWQFSSYCNPKGRILALLYIYRKGDNYRLILPADIADATLKRLQMYVLRSKVKLHLSDELLLGLCSSSADTLGNILPTIPQQPFSMQYADELAILRVGDSPARIMISAAAADISKLWQSATTALDAAGSERWRHLDIISGYPQVFATTKEMFIPQMLNLDALHGINFKKGCYPGQEIVARMHYLGKLKKRMYLGSVIIHAADMDKMPKPGDPVYSDSFGSQAAGNVVDAVDTGNDTYILLLSAQITSADNNDFHIMSADGASIELEALPYPLPQSSKSGTA